MYKSIFNTCEYTYSDRGSRFLTFAYPVSTEPDVGRRLNECKQHWPDASHHCYGWRINPEQVTEYANDDGEPSGTAGRPILNEIISFELINVLVVVARYFGGTKLGKPGLIDAYRKSARYCLQQAVHRPLHPVRRLTITFPYPEQKTVSQLQYNYGLIKTGEEYLAEATWRVSCPEEQSNGLLDQLTHLQHRGIRYEDGGKHYEPMS